MTITNCTFDGNETTYNSGAAITTRAESRVEIINTIVSNTLNGRSVYLLEETPTVISHCDFYRNDNGDWIETLSELEGREGNITADPLYVDTNNLDYHLSEGSLCIDAGSADVNPDPDGSPSDIGAYYYHHANDVDLENSPNYPSEIQITGTYPNPFNSTTTLIYTMGQSNTIEMTVFDVLGRFVDRASLGFQQAGRHIVSWKAEGIPSGVYFISLKAGNQNSIVRVDFIK